MWERCCMVQHSSLRAIFTGFRAREHHSQYCSWEKYRTICCLEKWQLSGCVNCERHWVFDLGKENAREETLRQSRALCLTSEQFDYTNVTRDPFQTYSCQKSRSFSLTKSTQELWCSILVLHFSQSFSTQSCYPCTALHWLKKSCRLSWSVVASWPVVCFNISASFTSVSLRALNKSWPENYSGDSRSVLLCTGRLASGSRKLAASKRWQTAKLKRWW